MQETEVQVFQDSLNMHRTEITHLRACIRRSDAEIQHLKIQMKNQIQKLTGQIREMENSTTWRIFEPSAITSQDDRQEEAVPRRHGRVVVAGRLRDPAELSGPSVRHVRVSYVEDQYPTLVRNSRLRASDLRRLRDEMATFGYKPLISLLMPVSNVERLERSLDSVVDQVYPNWELCVCCDEDIEERIRGTLSRYQRLDERIKVGHPGTDAHAWNALCLWLPGVRRRSGRRRRAGADALFEVVKLLQEHTDSDLIYSDEDEVDEVGSRARPRFKPDWAPDLLLSSDYISRLSVYRMSLLKEVGGFREGFDDCQDYDLALRATERTDRIQHVSKVLYHRRSSTGSPASPEDGPGVERTRRALSEALERRGLEGSVEDGLPLRQLQGETRDQGRAEG